MGAPPGNEQPETSSTGADTAATAANQRENGTTRPSILAIRRSRQRKRPTNRPTTGPGKAGRRIGTSTRLGPRFLIVGNPKYGDP